MIEFINVFLSYIILLFVMAAAAGGAVALGIHRRKVKNLQTVDTAVMTEENNVSEK